MFKMRRKPPTTCSQAFVPPSGGGPGPAGCSAFGVDVPCAWSGFVDSDGAAIEGSTLLREVSDVDELTSASALRASKRFSVTSCWGSAIFLD